MDGDDTVDHVLIVLFDMSNTKLASYFMSLISRGRPYLQCVSFHMGNDSSSHIKINDILTLFIKYNNKIHSVIFFSDDVNDVVAVLEAVSLSEQLRYTGLLHTTEWFIVFTVLVDDVPYVLLERSKTVDFITLVYMPFINTTFIAQQSRVQNLTVRAKMINYNKHPGQPICEVSDWPGTSCRVLKSKKVILRKSARLFLKSQKSAMEGLRLPVAVGQTIVRGNMTKIDWHAMKLLGLVNASLGFRYQLVSSSDQSFYGMVTGDANGTGIAGLLARQDVALTTMPFTMKENRLKAVHYIPVRTSDEPSFIIYRWPRGRVNIDLIYIYIIDPPFIYMLVGTLLSLAVVGAVVHTATRSCSLQVTGHFSALDLRHMTSFTSHVYFKYPGPYVAHSGRILLACWAVFLVVLGSAYSAFLVTNFVTAEEPPIKSLKELASNKDFSVGLHGNSELTMYILNRSTDGVLSQFWRKLVADNNSDPDTFSNSTKLHIDKIIAGRHAYVGSSCVPLGQCEEYISENLTDLVFVPVEDRKLYGECFVATARNVFFKDDLYRFMLNVDEAGIFDYLRKKYLSTRLFNDAFVPLKSTIYQTHNESTRVGFERILFVVYLTLAGVGLGVVCLSVELIVYMLQVRNTMCS